MNLDDLRQLAAAAAESWTGCDWSTDHGATGIDLDGEIPADLRAAFKRLKSRWDDADIPIRPTRGVEQFPGVAEYRQAYLADLVSGADWIDKVEADAQAAADRAQEILDQIEAGELYEIKWRGSPCSIEATYGDCPTWRPWQDAVEAYLAAAD